MLARAVGSKIEGEMSGMLEQMFSVGLTVELTSALQVLAERIPNLQKEIQGQLWHCCSVCAFALQCACVLHSF